jgi:hypothetical protein
MSEERAASGGNGSGPSANGTASGQEQGHAVAEATRGRRKPID